MKKKILSLAFLVLAICIFSVKTFAQVVPGGSDNGTGTPPPAETGGTTGGSTGATTDLIFNLGSAGVIDIPSTSPYYNCISSLLTTYHIPIVNGVVTFPSVTCYNVSLFYMYYTKCINYNTYHTACKNVPSSCH